MIDLIRDTVDVRVQETQWPCPEKDGSANCELRIPTRKSTCLLLLLGSVVVFSRSNESRKVLHWYPAHIMLDLMP